MEIEIIRPLFKSLGIEDTLSIILEYLIVDNYCEDHDMFIRNQCLYQYQINYSCIRCTLNSFQYFKMGVRNYLINNLPESPDEYIYEVLNNPYKLTILSGFTINSDFYDGKISHKKRLYCEIFKNNSYIS